MLLLIAPARVAQFLLGTPLPSVGSLLVARIAGAALLAIGVSCYLEGRRPAAAPLTGLVGGLLVYNAVVFALLVYAALIDGLSGIGTWPAGALHLAMAIWCTRMLSAQQRTTVTGG